MIRAVICRHAEKYPRLAVRDLFKLLYQSAFGCEHLALSYGKVLSRIDEEYSGVCSDEDTVTDLGGDFCRVSLDILDTGLEKTTFARIFTLSAEEKSEGREGLILSLSVARELAEEGLFDFTKEELDREISEWEKEGYPAVRHSEGYRERYSPSYRVVAKKYARFLPLLALIDRKIRAEGKTVLAVEGGSASGKTTLSELLSKIYGAQIIHADDFFLRPEQRTARRLSEVGGNLDRERLLSEVLIPLSRGEEFSYRPYLCSEGALGDPVSVKPAALTVVEGAYSMHPDLRPYYGISAFLSITPELQRERVVKRNSPRIAERYFSEWIPLERAYFDGMKVESFCDIVIDTK